MRVLLPAVLLLLTTLGTAHAQLPPAGGADLAQAYAPLTLTAVMLDTGQALVWDELAKKYRLAAVGDSVAGWKVVAIESARMVVVSGDSRDELTLAAAPSPIAMAGKKVVAVTPPPPVMAPPPAPVAPKLQVEKRSISRVEFDKALADFDELARIMSAAPAQGGGFLLSRLVAPSVLSRLGLKQGDIVRVVAGVPLTNLDDAARAYGKLRGARHVTVQLDRPEATGLSQVTLEIDITGR